MSAVARSIDKFVRVGGGAEPPPPAPHLVYTLGNKILLPSTSPHSNSHGCHMACALIGLSHKLPTYNYYMGSLRIRLGLSVSGWMKTESAQVSGVKVRVRPAIRSAAAT